MGKNYVFSCSQNIYSNTNRSYNMYHLILKLQYLWKHLFTDSLLKSMNINELCYNYRVVQYIYRMVIFNKYRKCVAL